ncbi:response regulator [Alkalibacillus haloalkaliphilus]|uniref:response regulator n=1 Tax=Alkalibacillus haloalkaliphilus TaxID=94136 RepID=UPI00031F02EA|nr:response regulator [Alkalibacillus haloalkaliphilus]
MGKLKAVVIDDESGVSLLMKELLTQDGFEVFTFANAIEAFKVVENEHIDIFFVDYLLPGMREITSFKKLENKATNLLLF